MRLSLTIAGLHRTFGPELEHYLDLAKAADEVGIDQVVLADHVVMGRHTDAYPYGEFAFAPEEPWADPLALLTAIAAVTSIDSTAEPGPTRSRRMPSPRLALSSAHMASAQARATASASSVMSYPSM